MASGPAPFDPIVCVVDFHHARGPEVETWIGVEDGADPTIENEWPLLPFMALTDGAHASTEDFSYFTLRRSATSASPATSLFGIACTRQLDASELRNRPADVTRSTVQKAVVAILDSPKDFGRVREKLSFITKAWFNQRDFTDRDILSDFQGSLVKTLRDQEDERDQFFGLSLRELIHEFKYQTLILFKCLLLQPKMLFFGSHCERICMLQFSLISLIPGLIRHLQDCADPAFNSYEETFVPPTSLRTSERASLLSYVGLPLQLFGKGSLFGPYTPLQQLDILAENTTKSYVVGSTNSLLLSQKDKYADILVNLDDSSITICSQQLKPCLILTVPDRRWIDFLTQTVNETWDEQNPDRPITLGYAGSEEFIRLQFEEYLLALLSAVKYKQFMDSHRQDISKPQPLFTDIEGDPSAEFSPEWVKAWTKTENFRIFNKFTDSHIFDIVEPHHPCSGGLTVEDVQRRLASQVAELHLDERFQSGRDALNRHLAEGQKKVSTAFNSLWNDIEVMREAQRKRAAEQRAAAAADKDAASPTATNGHKQYPSVRLPKAHDFSHAQAGIQAAGKSAGAYFSSWGAWATEKRKAGWGRAAAGSQAATPAPSSPVADRGADMRKASAASFAGVDTKEAATSLGREKSEEKEEPGVEMADVNADANADAKVVLSATRLQAEDERAGQET